LKNKKRNSSITSPPSMSMKPGDYFKMEEKTGSSYLNAPIFSGNTTIGNPIRPEESYIHHMAPANLPNHLFG
jgi:hypothetical protein